MIIANNKGDYRDWTYIMTMNFKYLFTFHSEIYSFLLINNITYLYTSRGRKNEQFKKNTRYIKIGISFLKRNNLPFMGTLKCMRDVTQ